MVAVQRENRLALVPPRLAAHRFRRRNHGEWLDLLERNLPFGDEGLLLLFPTDLATLGIRREPYEPKRKLNELRNGL